MNTIPLKSVVTLVLFTCSLLAPIPTLADIPLSTRLPEMAKHGKSYKISIKTKPNVNCKILAQDPAFSNTFADKTTNRFGKAFWRFELPESYQGKRLPVTITVEKNGEHGKSTKYIDIME